MNNHEHDFDEDLDFDPDFESDFEPDYEPERPKFRLNPAKKRFNKDRLKNRLRAKKHRNLPAKKTLKEMSVRKAKKIYYGGRSPGRPSKELSDKIRQAKQVLQAAGEPLSRRNPVKQQSLRPRGRPRKLGVIKKEKRPRGRPRNPLVAPLNKVKRPRGRPKKEGVSSKIKRPRGRPRKNPLQQLVDNVKKRGRPRKNPEPPAESS